MLQIFAGRLGLVKPDHPPKFSPICLFIDGTFKIVIDIAKKKVDFYEQYIFLGGLMNPHSHKFAVVLPFKYLSDMVFM